MDELRSQTYLGPSRYHFHTVIGEIWLKIGVGAPFSTYIGQLVWG